MSIRKWHKGPPPFPGWWNASNFRDTRIWRWWDGERWGQGVRDDESPTVARALALRAAPFSNLLDIEWTHYWPKNARVKRVAP